MQNINCKIAMISVHSCPLSNLGGRESGGMSVYIRELTKKLCKKGIEIDIFTRQKSHSLPLVVNVCKGVRIIHLKAGEVTPCDKEELWYHLDQFTEGILKFNKGNCPYSLVHSHYWISGLVAMELRSEWGIPTVHMFHTLGRLKNLAAGDGNEKEGWLRLKSEKTIMDSADCLIALTPLEKAQMVWYYGASPQKIIVIPGGVDINLFKPSQGSSEWRVESGEWRVESEELEEKSEIQNPKSKIQRRKWILYVGRIQMIKGIETLIEAISIVTKEMGIDPEEIGLLIIGGDAQNCRGEEQIRLETIIKRYELGEVVKLTGPCSQEALPHHYRRSLVCVVPSYYESFGLVALESMACGIPVIASDVGGLKFIIQDQKTGILVKPHDPLHLASAIRMIFNDSALRQRLGQAGVMRARKFTWQRVADKVISLYDRMLQRTVISYQALMTNIEP